MIRFYNTLTRKKEEFKPLKDNLVRIYTCGPTVYDYAHLGNLRSYIFADVLRRTLKLAGYKVKQIINITDVGHLTSNEDEGEDKIEKGARREHKTPQEIATFYTKAFLSDLKKLNIEEPELLPKATDNIQEMIEMIGRIIEKGYAYETEEGIYFDTKKLKDYGQLSKQKPKFKRKSRIGKIKDKRNAADFALWLKATGEHKNHLQQWDSPWGKGFPGWHIECSAMSQKYLGDEFDIHTGGVDHIPVHHENEIAQSMAANNKIPARFFMHGDFLITRDKRMGKSEGNLITLADLEARGFSPLDFRFLCLTNHYRSQMIFSENNLKEASLALSHLREKVSFLELVQSKKGTLPNFEKNLKNSQLRVRKHFFDDLNTPLALSDLFILGRYLSQNQPGKIGKDQAERALKIYQEADQILSLGLSKKEKNGKIIKRVRSLAELRLKARLDGDYKKADGLRRLIENEGYKIEDIKEGFRLIKK